MLGLMQDRPLTLAHVFHRAEQLFWHKRLVTATEDGETSMTIADWARRVRRLATVLDTLNIRLFPEHLVYIANHAEDEVVFVDRSLIPLLAPLADKLGSVRHFVVIDDGADVAIPEGWLDYETLLAEAEPFDGPFVVEDENTAAAMCY